MPEYTRAYQPGGTFFLTLITHDRRRLFNQPANVELLRMTLRQVCSERPFEITAGVVLPDHLHSLWTLPNGDSDFSSRVGRMEALFTRAFRSANGIVGSAHPTQLRN